jgi:hypothetical protein
MIPENLLLRTPIPDKVKGQLLVKLRDGRFLVTSSACPKCSLGPQMRLVAGWMFLHEQPAKPMDLSKAEPS